MERFDKSELLKPANMLKLYAQGAFPMADKNGEIDWYYPESRTIIPLDNYNVPRSLKKFMRETKFEYLFSNDAMRVVQNCAHRKETWISEQLIDAYEGLLKTGNLHSVEVYSGDELIGGLYGVTYNGAFFGESMFSKVSQASKCALVKLIEHLNNRKFVLLDVQFQNEHLKMFGTVEISLDDFSALLLRSYSKNVSF